MPRRGSASPSRPRARSPVSNVPARSPPPVHTAPAVPAPSAVAQPRQPGMFAQMATTAAGVAVGSAVGHTLGATMMGGGRQDQPEAVQEQAAPMQPMYGQAAQQQELGGSGSCQVQMKQFLECAQSQHDITLCQGFNEALRECKMRYGLSG